MKFQIMSKISTIFFTISIILIFMYSSLFCQAKDSVIHDTICSCKPSLPIEIAATSLTWGIVNTWIWRGTFIKQDATEFANIQVFLFPEALFLLMFTLGPISEWTSVCETSWWNTLWIGLSTAIASDLIYGSIYGFQQAGDVNHIKYKLQDYFFLGILPSAGSCLIYNLFLHPKEKKDQSMYLIPFFGGKNTASLNFMMQF